MKQKIIFLSLLFLLSSFSASAMLRMSSGAMPRTVALGSATGLVGANIFSPLRTAGSHHNAGGHRELMLILRQIRWGLDNHNQRHRMSAGLSQLEAAIRRIPSGQQEFLYLHASTRRTIRDSWVRRADEARQRSWHAAIIAAINDSITDWEKKEKFEEIKWAQWVLKKLGEHSSVIEVMGVTNQETPFGVDRETMQDIRYNWIISAMESHNSWHTEFIAAVNATITDWKREGKSEEIKWAQWVLEIFKGIG